MFMTGEGWAVLKKEDVKERLKFFRKEIRKEVKENKIRKEWKDTVFMCVSVLWFLFRLEIGNTGGRMKKLKKASERMKEYLEDILEENGIKDEKGKDKYLNCFIDS